MKLLRTKSTMRYLPPKGTAGFARSLVSGYRRVPFPPARTIPSTRSLMRLFSRRGAGDPNIVAQTAPGGLLEGPIARLVLRARSQQFGGSPGGDPRAPIDGRPPRSRSQ